MMDFIFGLKAVWDGVSTGTVKVTFAVGVLILIRLYFL